MTTMFAAAHPLVEASGLFSPAVCALVHAPGAECGICNPVRVDGWSNSPTYLRERLAVGRKLEDEWTRRLRVLNRKAHSRLWRRARIFLHRLGRFV